MKSIIENTYIRNTIKIRNVWFAEQKDIENAIGHARQDKVDVINFHGVKLASEISGWEEQYTIMTDLEETEEQLFSKIRKNYRYEIRRVESYLYSGNMIVTVGFFESVPYVFHSYILNESNVRFFYSTSPFRKEKEFSALIGRMNKGLHWHDILMFKEKKVRIYDWGGISCKEAVNGIDQFKKGFGGYIERYFNKSLGLSLKGKMAVMVKGKV